MSDDANETSGETPGIRVGVAHDLELARLMRAHNDAQVICFGERNPASRAYSN